MASVRSRSILRVGALAAILFFVSPPAAFAEDPPTTEVPFELERDVTECVSANPPPNCGRKPTSSGDRGGAMQFATLGAIALGLGVIFTVVFRNTVRADKAKSAALPEDKPGYF
jgi:hypothetical protein